LEIIEFIFSFLEAFSRLQALLYSSMTVVEGPVTALFGHLCSFAKTLEQDVAILNNSSIERPGVCQHWLIHFLK
jgi:hypothetical protein